MERQEKWREKRNRSASQLVEVEACWGEILRGLRSRRASRWLEAHGRRNEQMIKASRTIATSQRRTCDEHNGRLAHAGVHLLPVHHVRVESADSEPVDRGERPLVPDVEAVVQGTCSGGETASTGHNHSKNTTAPISVAVFGCVGRNSRRPIAKRGPKGTACSGGVFPAPRR